MGRLKGSRSRFKQRRPPPPAPPAAAPPPPSSLQAHLQEVLREEIQCALPGLRIDVALDCRVTVRLWVQGQKEPRECLQNLAQALKGEPWTGVPVQIHCYPLHVQARERPGSDIPALAAWEQRLLELTEMHLRDAPVERVQVQLIHRIACHATSQLPLSEAEWNQVAELLQHWLRLDHGDAASISCACMSQT